mmetsp:Transcript_100345/g.199052  ORF Transcript_100345/g.199052 Transcript_100345/m.199052 type:complete len:754 (-) Transcript_100345:89-2350(-)
MSTHVPSSPSLSPGRNLLRSIPQSPSLGFRATPLAGAPLPNVALTSRHAKSTSDLGHGRQSRYDPGRLALGPARPTAASSSTSGCGSHIKGASPIARVTPNSAVHVSSQHHNRGGSPMPNAKLSPRTDTPSWTAAHGSGSISRHCTPHGSRQSTTTCGQSSAFGGRTGTTPPPQWRHTRSSVGRAAMRSTAATGPGQRGNSLDTGASHSSPSWTANRGSAPVTESLTAVQGPPPRGQVSTVNSAGQAARSPAGRAWVMGGSSARSSPRTTQTHGSARLPNSQWSHSITHLGNSSKAVALDADMKPEVAAEALVALAMGDANNQMVQVRDSLLQHINSVQKEITRLQAEKGRSQRNTKASINSPRLSVRTHTPSDKLNAGARVSQSRCLPKDQLDTALASSNGPAHAEPMAPQRTGPATTTWAPRSAATKIQRTWRRKRLNCNKKINATAALAETPTGNAELSRRRSPSGQAPGSNDAPHRPLAIHHAAARIQRVWRLSRWRRLFVSFSADKVGWVGSIEWLRNRNMLYGTELAEPEDVNWWVEQRAVAPLDREVDPWGCTKLRDHLNKMWYGLTTEELQARLEQLEASQVAQSRHAQPSSASQSHSNGGGNSSSSHRSPRRTERASAVRTATSMSPRHESRSARSEDLGHGPRINARSSAAVQNTLQSLPSPPQTHRSARVGAQATALAQVSQKTSASGSAVGRVTQDVTSRRWTGSRRSLPALTSSWNVPQSCSSTASAVRGFRLQATTVSR